MSRAQFIERMKSPFLVAFIEGRPAQEFHTRVATKNSAPPRAVENFACVKAPGNPYLDRISIGRAANCDIVLRDASPSASSSASHRSWSPSSAASSSRSSASSW
jgi:hypothetical protein